MNNNLVNIPKKNEPKNKFKIAGNEFPKRPTKIMSILKKSIKRILPLLINFSLTK